MVLDKTLTEFFNTVLLYSIYLHRSIQRSLMNILRPDDVMNIFSERYVRRGSFYGHTQMEPQYYLFQFSYIQGVIIHADDYLFLKDFFTGSKTGMVWTMNLTRTEST